MEYKEAKEIAIELFAIDYKLDRHLAKRIVNDLDIDEALIERYEEEIKDRDENKDNWW